MFFYSVFSPFFPCIRIFPKNRPQRPPVHLNLIYCPSFKLFIIHKFAVLSSSLFSPCIFLNFLSAEFFSDYRKNLQGFQKGLFGIITDDISRNILVTILLHNSDSNSHLYILKLFRYQTFPKIVYVPMSIPVYRFSCIYTSLVQKKSSALYRKKANVSSMVQQRKGKGGGQNP